MAPPLDIDQRSTKKRSAHESIEIASVFDRESLASSVEREGELTLPIIQADDFGAA